MHIDTVEGEENQTLVFLVPTDDGFIKQLLKPSGAEIIQFNPKKVA